MLYLNDKIDVTVSFPATTEDGIHQYKVVDRTDNTTIFVGNCFIPKGATSKTFNLNNILKSRYFINPYLRPDVDISTIQHLNTDQSEFKKIYNVEVLGNNANVDGIVLLYRYPVYKKYLGRKMFADFNTYEDIYKMDNQHPFLLTPMLQGVYNGYETSDEALLDMHSILPPRYPNNGTNNYSIIFSFYFADIDEEEIFYFENVEDYGNNIFFEQTDYHIFNFPLSKINTYGSLNLFHPTDQGDDYIEYAYLDNANYGDCPAKYYLQWQDRMGGIQSQPFNGTDTITNTYDTVNIQDYLSNTSVKNINVETKFKINTGWINEKLYPIYESIFVSPYLKLYDTENDKAYFVYVTDSEFTEKTYDNQSKLFNLELNLTVGNKQNFVF